MKLDMKQAAELIRKLRQPAALFGITAGAALIILILLYVQLVWPVQARIREADRALADMTKAKEQAESLPLPQEVTGEMAAALFAKLPAAPSLDAFLVTMYELEQATDTTIMALEQSSAAKQQAAADTPPPNLSSSEGQMQDFLDAAAGNERTPRSVQTGSGLQELHYELTAQGGYDALLSLMDRLQSESRIILLGEWNIAALDNPTSGMADESEVPDAEEPDAEEPDAEEPDAAAEAAEAGDDGTHKAPVYTLKADLYFYYSDEYADLLEIGEKE